MRSTMKMYLALGLSLSLACTGVLADADPQGGRHELSAEFGAAAGEAARDFGQGVKKVATPFVVVGKTVIDGVAFVTLSSAAGLVYVAEDAILGVKYLAKGAKFVLINTAQGAFWVAVGAIAAGAIVFDAVVDLSELVIEGVVYTLVKLEQGVTFVAKSALKGGQIVIGGVIYVMKETAEGIVWVTVKTWNAIKAGANWSRSSVLVASVRSRLSRALLAGDVGQSTLDYFRTMATNAKASPNLRRVAGAALAACTSFNAAYANGH